MWFEEYADINHIYTCVYDMIDRCMVRQAVYIIMCMCAGVCLFVYVHAHIM